jgi:glycosyltransferase involved in cell wall biosynthesis
MTGMADRIEAMEFPAEKNTHKVSGAPVVSIIVPTFNRGRFLERCLRSILDQTYRNIECLVMDGGSKDESVAILKRLAESDPRLKYISEPDNGEVYATNKGFDLATGEIIGVQASDDFYVPDAVQKAVEFLLARPEYVGVGGDAMYVDEEGRSLNRGVITYRGEMSKETIRHILTVRYKSCLVCHGSFFGWRGRILEHGKLDPAFSVTPDWEFYLRLLDAGERIGCLPRVQYKYSVHSGMGALKHNRKVETERAILHQKYGMTWRHELARSTAGRLMSYLSNPYRSPFISGLYREVKAMLARRGQ